MVVFPHRCYSILKFGNRHVMIERYPNGHYVATTSVCRPVAEGSSLEKIKEKLDTWYERTYGLLVEVEIRDRWGGRVYFNWKASQHKDVSFEERTAGQFVAIVNEHPVVAHGESSADVHRQVEAWGEQFLQLSEEESAGWLPEPGAYEDAQDFVEPMPSERTTGEGGLGAVLGRLFGQ